MYYVSGAVEMGNADDLILSIPKPLVVGDDTEPNSQDPEEYFDE